MANERLFRIPGNNFELQTSYPYDYDIISNWLRNSDIANNPRLLQDKQYYKPNFTLGEEGAIRPGQLRYQIQPYRDLNRINVPNSNVQQFANRFPSYGNIRYGGLTPGGVLEGGISKSINANDINKAIDTLYNKDNKSRIPTISGGKIISGVKQYAPVTGDIWDITHGFNRLKDSDSGIGKALGAGQLALGLAGLASIPFTLGAGSIVKGAGRAAIKNAIKKYGKNVLKSAIGKRRIYDALHGNWRLAPEVITGIYDSSSSGGDTIKQEDTSQEDNNLKDALQQVEPSEYEKIDIPTIGDIFGNDTSTPSGVPTEQLKYDDNYGPTGNIGNDIIRWVNERGLEKDNAQYNKDGDPVNLAGMKELLKKQGFSDNEATAILNGLNGGRKDIDDYVKYYNTIANPGQQINIPKSEYEANRIKTLLGNVDNNEQVSEDEANYINNVLDNYNRQRSYYDDYRNSINDLANNYGDRWLLDYSLRSGGFLPEGQPSVTQMMKDRANLYKTAGDVNTSYDKTILQALSNYNIARELGLPLGSDFASDEMIKYMVDRQNNEEKAYNKLITELLKMQHTSRENALNRQSKYDIANLQVRAANDRARLSRELENKKLLLRKAQIEGNWKLQAEIRDSINVTNMKLNAARILGEAGIYGVEDPSVYNQAIKILGYDNPINFNGGTNSIENEFINESRK